MEMEGDGEGSVATSADSCGEGGRVEGEEAEEPEEEIGFEKRRQLESLIVSGSGIRRRSGESTKKYLGRVTHLRLSGKGLEVSDFPRGALKELCPKLDSIYIYDNKLKSPEFLEGLREITHLYAGNNQLRNLKGICAVRIEKLALDCNSIERLEGLEDAVRLRELYLANQNIPSPLEFSIDTIAVLGQCLLHLDVSGNGIQDVEALTNLSALVVLNLSNNSVVEMGQVVELVRALQDMKELDMRGNPVCRQHKYYERIVARSGNKLRLMDGRLIPQSHRDMLCQLERHTRKVGNSKQRAHRPRRSLGEDREDGVGNISLEIGSCTLMDESLPLFPASQY